MHETASVGAPRALIAGMMLASLALFVRPAPANTGYLARAEVQAFIRELHSQHGLELQELERILGAARHLPRVVSLIGPPPVAEPPGPRRVRSYAAYRTRFVNSTRITTGLRFWAEHEAILQRAEREFGVPAEYILGILGVETVFGRNTGSFRVLDALTTIAFDGQRRREYFRDELVQFLLLARELGADPLSIKGSYAGAMGLPQFMPSSYRRHAVDYDGDGRIDLAGSPADAIGSIASYLEAHGWTADEPVAIPVRLSGPDAADLVSGLERRHTIEQLKDRGVRFPRKTLPAGGCSLIELPTPGKTSTYWVGFGNFEAITRYNRSTFYAASVVELAEAIRAARRERS